MAAVAAHPGTCGEATHCHSWAIAAAQKCCGEPWNAHWVGHTYRWVSGADGRQVVAADTGSGAVCGRAGAVALTCPANGVLGEGDDRGNAGGQHEAAAAGAAGGVDRRTTVRRMVRNPRRALGDGHPSPFRSSTSGRSIFVCTIRKWDGRGHTWTCACDTPDTRPGSCGAS